MQSFWRYSASKDGLTLKTGLGFIQGHWKWHHLIDRVWVPIRLPLQPWRYPVSFARYTDLLVENRAIFIPHLYLAPRQGMTPSEFREDLDIHKTRMNGLSCGEESMTIYSAVLIQCQRVTDGQTDGRTDGRPAYIYYVLQHSWRTLKKLLHTRSRNGFFVFNVFLWFSVFFRF